MVDPSTSIDLTTGSHSVRFGSVKGVARLAIRNNGNWYVSETTVSASETTIGNLNDESWAPVSIVPGVTFKTPSAFS